MEYRRDRTMGGAYFFTVVTSWRRPVFDDPAPAELRASFRQVRAKWSFTIDAAVVLPDHLHFIWTMPAYDSDCSLRWRLIKRTVTAASLIPKPLRQNRFWEHRDDRDFALHLDYIHWNPVEHDLARQPWEWKYSSFLRLSARAPNPPDWHPAAAPTL